MQLLNSGDLTYARQDDETPRIESTYAMHALCIRQVRSRMERYCRHNYAATHTATLVG